MWDQFQIELLLFLKPGGDELKSSDFMPESNYYDLSSIEIFSISRIRKQDWIPNFIANIIYSVFKSKSKLKM